MCQTENKFGRVGKEIGNNTSKNEDIAEAAGVTFERSFVLDDGDTV